MLDPLLGSLRRSLGSLWLLPAVLVLGVLAAGCSDPSSDLGSAGPAEPTSTTSPAATRRSVNPVSGARLRAVRVLHAWDAAREHALTDADPRAVRSLYRPGSGLAAQDLALLRRYGRRDVRLTDLEQQTLAVDVRVAGTRVVELAVTERLAVAQVDLGTASARLPTSAAVRRVLRFERDRGGAWRLSSVTAG